ncbi:hypothetical protein CWI38_0119p0060 [Hamiltosporidium tvaerminnensis]|uniref:Uncharacterized protein n=1 Tax=Hamiltosporidium tvaerminnensis TaxID=1176355 RepID=A0A4V2JY88_9MICR|nr:hypothetical protein CWI38_0119p0060 [Hamiltosporidium tvaerminnensis]
MIYERALIWKIETRHLNNKINLNKKCKQTSSKRLRIYNSEQQTANKCKKLKESHRFRKNSHRGSE